MASDISKGSGITYQKTQSDLAASGVRRLVVKGVCITVIFALLPFVTFHCLPLLKPVGLIVLRRLWDVLLFVILTTAVSLAILNNYRKDMAQNSGVLRIDMSPGSAIFGETKQCEIESYTFECSPGKLVTRTSLENKYVSNCRNVGSPQQLRIPALEMDHARLSTFGSVENLRVEQNAQGTSRSTAIESGSFFCDPKRNSSSVGDKQSDNSMFNGMSVSNGEDDDHAARFSLSHSDTFVGPRRPHRRSRSLDQQSQTQQKISGKDSNLPSTDTPLDVPVDNPLDKNESDDQTIKSRTRRPNVSFSFDYGETYRPVHLPHQEEEETDISDKPICALSPSGTATKGKSSPPVAIQPSSPQAISSSSHEVNMKADAFIAKFREQMRVQRLESLDRHRKRLNHRRP
eukprot:c3521_g1_i1 orf=191-1396(-)